MRREREWPYSAYRFNNSDSCKTRRIAQSRHPDRCSQSVIQRYIPSLSELKSIKEAKLRRIKDLVQNDLYDTPQRQIETARRIKDILLAGKDGGN